MIRYVVYLKCKGNGCTQSIMSDSHQRFSSRSPIKAWLKLQRLRRKYYKSEYFMIVRWVS